MQKIEAVAVGIILGLLYGLILAASMDAFSFASWILYGNQYTIPLATSLFTGILSYVTVVTYELWLEPVQKALVDGMERFQDTYAGNDDTEDEPE